MYRIKYAEYNATIEETLTITLVKQQAGVDLPILCETLEEADGVVLSDGNTMLGISGRNMENYTPLVTVEEISAEPYIFDRLDKLDEQTSQRVQRGHMECVGESVTIPLQEVDPDKATVTVNGPVKAYVLSNDALTMQLTEAGFINWEVRG